MNHRFLPALIACLFVLTATAQETPTPTEPVQPAEPTPPIPVEPTKADTRTEKSIYVPYEDLEKIFEEDGRGVFLPYKEFLDLWNQLTIEKDEEEVKPPTDGVLSSATYTARVVGEKNRVLEIDATLQVESFKEKGWAVIPLLKGGMNIAEAETGEATINLGKNGHELILPKKGQYTIRLKLFAKLNRSAGKNTVGLSLPKAGVSKFDAIIPEQGWDFDIQPGAAYSTESLPDGTTQLSFFFGETESFNVTWQKQGEETKLTPLLFVESYFASTVIPGALQTEVSLDYRVLRSGVEKFVVTVPSGHEVLNVAGENIREWDVMDLGGAQRLTVDLHAPAKQNYTLRLSLEQALDALPTEFDVPQVLAENVVRQRGSVVLNYSGELEIEVVDAQSLTQQSLGGSTPDGEAMSTFGRYRFLAMPFGMSVAVKKAEPKIEVESWTRFSVETDTADFETRFDYTVKRVGIFDAVIEVPDGFESIEATGPNIEDYSLDEAAQLLTVKFSQRAIGNFSFTVTGRRARANAEDDETVPVFSPQNVERHEGKIGIGIHTSLDPNTKKTGDLRQQDVGAMPVDSPGRGNDPFGGKDSAPPVTGIPAGGPIQIGFRYRGTATPAIIGFAMKETQVNVELFTSIDIGEQLVRYRWTVSFDILYAGVDQLVYSLPTEIADNLRVDGDLIKETNKTYTDDTITLTDGRVLWATVLREKKLGRYELKLSYDRPLEAAEDGSLAVNLPEIQIENVFRETGQIAVTKDDNLEVLEATPRALEPVDPSELRGGLNKNGVFLAYKYRRHPIGLDLDISRNEFLEVPKAIVTWAVITSVVSTDKATSTEVVYWVKNNAEQFFSVSLPEGGEMISDIYVNGQPQQPMSRADEDVVLIRLPVGGSDSHAFPVRFVYETPSPKPGEAIGSWDSVTITPPSLTNSEVLQSQTTLFLPNGYLYRKFDSSMRLPMSERGWFRFRNLFDWIIPALGPQIPHHGHKPWTDPPSLDSTQLSGFDVDIPKEGRPYQLHRLDAPAPVKVSIRSKGFVFFIEALFFLLAFAGGIAMFWRDLRWKLIYFAAVGLIPLVISGAVAPTSASFWQAITLGVFFAAAVWIGIAAIKLLPQMLEKIRERRRNKTKRIKPKHKKAKMEEADSE